jgi:glycosyltransferase involved in cell wall biosynthesis
MFLSGKIISTNGLYGRKVTAAHGVTPYIYVDRDPSAMTTPIPEVPISNVRRPGRVLNSTVVTTDKSAVGLFYDNVSTKMSGCYKLSVNLIAGLTQLKIPFHANRLTPVLNGCLQGCSLFQFSVLPPNTLIGPEIMVLPTEKPGYFRTWTNWVQPSDWCVNYFKEFPTTKNNRIFSWPVGIDTDKFNLNGRGDFTYDCFLYYKDVTNQVTPQILSKVEAQLSKLNLRYTVLKYGKYKEPDFMNIIKKSKFGIFLTGTESQGIAYMEALSMGCPLYIMDTNEFVYEKYKYVHDSVSSAPYFSEECGMKVKGYDLGDAFQTFLGSLSSYDPRAYIISNHTLERGAKKYYDILLEINRGGL